MRDELYLLRLHKFRQSRPLEEAQTSKPRPARLEVIELDQVASAAVLSVNHGH